MNSLSVPVETIKLSRRALSALLDTHRGGSKAALAAVKQGFAAYLLLFTDEEKAQVLDRARRLREESPESSFLRSYRLETFEEAIQACGTSLIREALGDDAEKGRFSS